MISTAALLTLWEMSRGTDPESGKAEKYLRGTGLWTEKWVIPGIRRTGILHNKIPE